MIKLFEQFNNEQEIIDICKKYNIKRYTINDDGSIDVDGDVDLYKMNLNKLPIKFNKVNGYFSCSWNVLTSLEGCPNITNSNFSCSYNNLTSLDGSPNKVGWNFDCSSNQLTSLEGCPMEVDVDFICYNNNLTSLEGCPLRVSGTLSCINNKITTLKGFPMIIEGNLDLMYNPISIIDSSVEVKGDIYISDTNFDDKIKSLSQEKLKILFEHGVDYDIYKSDGTINDSRLERLFKDFEV